MSKNLDWLNKVIDSVAATNSSLDMKALFALARENGIDTVVAEAQAEPKTAGLIRMRIGNQLRARAKRRHGLIVAGKFIEAPAEFLKGHPKTEKPNGEKIAGAANPKKEKEAA